MKLKNIHFIECPIFGNLTLDFTNETGMASDTVIIAGENGVGKSLLLETILHHHIPIRSMDFKQEVHFQYELTQLEAEKIDFAGHTKHRKKRDNVLEVKTTKYQDRSVKGGTTVMLLNGEKLRPVSSKDIHSDVEKMRKVLFSAAEINYTADPVKNVTNLDIDGGIKAYKRNNELASTISQLLVNVESLDAIDFAKWAKQKQREQVDYSKVDRGMRRFTAAFDDIFPTKKFKEIQQIGDEKKISLRRMEEL